MFKNTRIYNSYAQKISIKVTCIIIKFYNHKKIKDKKIYYYYII